VEERKMKLAKRIFLVAAVAVTVLTIQTTTFAIGGSRAIASSHRLDGTEPMPPYPHMDGTEPMPPYPR
jgi:hypothetical protein